MVEYRPLSRWLLGACVAALPMIIGSVGVAQAGPIGVTLPDCNCAINMTEHGGPVMTGAVDTFAIYYGDFTAANTGHPITAEQVVANWLGAMNGTSYLNIASTYTGAPNGTVSTDVTFNGQFQVPTNYLGNSLTDANILQIVQDAKSANDLPTVANAIYFVFTAPGIREQQDNVACGWHNGNVATSTVYSWVGPAIPCDFLGGNVSGNPVGNEFTETGSHELFESLTDPFLNAYSDPVQGEVGDVCNSSNFDANLNGTHVDVQSIFALDPSNPNGGVCAQGFVSATGVPEPSTAAILLAALLGWRFCRRAARV